MDVQVLNKWISLLQEENRLALVHLEGKMVYLFLRRRSSIE